MDSIKKVIEKLNEIGERMNISLQFVLQDDGSCSIEEFWSEDSIHSFENLDELFNFLNEVAVVNGKKSCHHYIPDCDNLNLCCDICVNH